MQITYIYHSCFSIELEQHILLFDYYQGNLPAFPLDKKLYIFASHRHHDHFSEKIFQIKHPNITYILSNDIAQQRRDVHFMGPHETLLCSDVKVSTLKSTDEGVAFLVNVEGKCIYHAGDLNWWDWGSEDSEEESKAMKEAYQTEIDRIKEKKIDIAFVPVDGRLQEHYYKGMDYLMRSLKVERVFPMHFWKDYEICNRLYLHKSCKGYQNKIQMIERKNQNFTI